MATHVGALAQLVNGRVVGDPALAIDGVADLASAGSSQLSFLSDEKYRAAFDATKAAAVLVNREYEPRPCTLIVCQNPYLALARIATQLCGAGAPPPGIAPGAQVSPTASIAPSACVEAGAIIAAGARIGPETHIMGGAYVGRDARVGAGAVLHPGSRLLHDCEAGDRVVLQSGAVIGSDGFGYAQDEQGRSHKIPQIGRVVLEDDVEIGANSTIDRATFGETRIGRGTKIDNLVQLAHNVTLGEHCIVVSQSGVAGSTTIGNRVVIGAQVGIVGHSRIADGVVLAAGTGVPSSIEKPGVYSGRPSLPHQQWLRMVAAQKGLPDMRKRLQVLGRKLDEVCDATESVRVASQPATTP